MKKLKLNVQERFEKLTVAFGESTMSRTQVQLWYNWFKEGQEDANGNACPGCPSTSLADENSEGGKKLFLNHY